MRARAVLLLALLALAGCGSGEEVRPLPEAVEGTVPAPQETQTGETPEVEPPEDVETTGEQVPGGGVPGDPEAGERVFAEAGCGTCHVLQAAGATGTIGPSLDEAQPPYELIVDRVTNGKGAMPAFGDQLSEDQIQDVSAYVFQQTHED